MKLIANRYAGFLFLLITETKLKACVLSKLNVTIVTL